MKHDAHLDVALLLFVHAHDCAILVLEPLATRSEILDVGDEGPLTIVHLAFGEG